jgi:hypothetical protein
MLDTRAAILHRFGEWHALLLPPSPLAIESRSFANYPQEKHVENIVYSPIFWVVRVRRCVRSEKVTKGDWYILPATFAFTRRRNPNAMGVPVGKISG